MNDYAHTERKIKRFNKTLVLVRKYEQQLTNKMKKSKAQIQTINRQHQNLLSHYVQSNQNKSQMMHIRRQRRAMGGRGRESRASSKGEAAGQLVNKVSHY
jgi:hypothetical protein